MSLYPRLMWRPDGRELTVYSEAEQQERAAEGCRLTAEPEPASDPPTYGPPDDGTGEGPTEGDAHDDTHEKRSAKKKK